MDRRVLVREWKEKQSKRRTKQGSSKRHSTHDTRVAAKHVTEIPKGNCVAELKQWGGGGCHVQHANKQRKGGRGKKRKKEGRKEMVAVKEEESTRTHVRTSKRARTKLCVAASQQWAKKENKRHARDKKQTDTTLEHAQTKCLQCKAARDKSNKTKWGRVEHGAQRKDRPTPIQKEHTPSSLSPSEHTISCTKEKLRG